MKKVHNKGNRFKSPRLKRTSKKNYLKKESIQRIKESSELIDIRTNSELSTPETLISNILKELGISFVRESYHSELFNPKTNRLLFFDFFLPAHKLVIEYDGLHHYKPINGKSSLKSQKEKDKIKDKFCKKFGYKMMRIPYYKRSKIKELLITQLKSNLINSSC